MIDKFMSQLTLTPPPIFLTEILDRICTDLRNNPGGCQIGGNPPIGGTLTCLYYISFTISHYFGMIGKTNIEGRPTNRKTHYKFLSTVRKETHFSISFFIEAT